MAGKKKGTDTPKPESKAPIALLRIEQDTQPKPITAEQKADRLAAAGACFDEADVLEREHLLLSSQAAEKKKSAAAKRAEGRQIVHDANSGVMQEPYAKIVERHPLHPYEMISWKVPDGVVPADILDIGGDYTGQKHIERRMGQGCIEMETRAMKPEELEVAKRADWEKSNPGLPYPDVAGEAAIAKMKAAIDEGGNGGDVLQFPGLKSVAAAEGGAVIEEMGGTQAAAAGDDAAATPDGATTEDLTPLYTKHGEDGWPLCPACGLDELHSPAIPRTEDTIIHCNACGWRPPVPAIKSRHLKPLEEGDPLFEFSCTECGSGPGEVHGDNCDDAGRIVASVEEQRRRAAAGGEATDDEAPPDLDEAEKAADAAEVATEDDDPMNPSDLTGPEPGGPETAGADPGWCEKVRRALSKKEAGAQEAACANCGKVLKLRPVVEDGEHVATLPRHKTQAAGK